MEVAAREGPHGLVDRMDRAVSTIAAASGDLLRTVRQFDELRLWRRDGATSMSSWLAARYGIGWGTAREWVRVARALRTLPRIADAYAAARLSWDQLRPLTRFATAESDDHWSRRGAQLRPSSLWREAERRERATARQAADIHRQRYLSL